MVTEFEEARKRNSGMIIDSNLKESVASMQFSLMEQATERKVSYEPEPPGLVELGGLSRVLPDVTAEIRRELPSVDVAELSRKFNLPQDFVSTVSRCISELLASADEAQPRQE